MQPKRIQRKRTKGWRMPENTVAVDRSTRWGNPFLVGKHGTAEECVRLYQILAAGYYAMNLDNLESQRDSLRALKHAREKLAGKNLACWCKPGAPCHADVLLELANAGPTTHSTV